MKSEAIRRALMVLCSLSTAAACQAGSTPTSVPTIVPTTPAHDAPAPPEHALPPANLNPLTGQPFAEHALIKTPAVLISISHFPAWGRPQAGLSFAPMVYETSITEGATRFLAIFYGGFQAPEIPATGNCALRWGAFIRTGTILGGRAWLDLNADGRRDFDERGVGGVCINLFDQSGALLQQTTTDSNGHYGFNLEPGRYKLEFVAPPWAAFSASNIGDGEVDSDADQMTGRLEVDVRQDALNVDAGLIALDNSVLNPDPKLMPLAQVGPIRSGRLVHGHIANSFQNSCLIYAGASEEVLIKLPKCLMVFHQFAGGGYMLDLDQLRAVAKQNRRDKRSAFDYSANVFADEPPLDGQPADQLDVFIAYLNQSGWTYDPLYQAYLRFVDTSETETAGLLFADVDRLTGRQLHFENVIVLFAEHEVISPTNLDIHLEQGTEGPAVLFRDGMAYEIRWSMPAHDGGREDGRPMQWFDKEGAPFPLKPGHTWVIVVTPFSTLGSQGPEWELRFNAPEGSALGE